ncbi:hypothetical protein D5086_008069 [Populus alba]|uniref:Uncharacterized protein n=1 Tax=Populus alba TaxID=43335 RepID=A0ACC4CET3_POPAL
MGSVCCFQKSFMEVINGLGSPREKDVNGFIEGSYIPFRPLIKWPSGTAGLYLYVMSWRVITIEHIDVRSSGTCML